MSLELFGVKGTKCPYLNRRKLEHVASGQGQACHVAGCTRQPTWYATGVQAKQNGKCNVASKMFYEPQCVRPKIWQEGDFLKSKTLI